MFAKTGPLTNRNARRPVVRSSSITSVPVMSDGMRSGVNWMRLKFSFSTLASVEIISVLARPGTPTSRQWPAAEHRLHQQLDDRVLADDHLVQLGEHLGLGLVEVLDDPHVGGLPRCLGHGASPCHGSHLVQVTDPPAKGKTQNRTATVELRVRSAELLLLVASAPESLCPSRHQGQNRRGDREVRHDSRHVHQRRDERPARDGRVQAHPLEEERQHRSDDVRRPLPPP